MRKSLTPLLMIGPLLLAGVSAHAGAVKPQRSTFSFPWPGSTQIALIGDEMVRQGSYLASDGVQLDQPVTIGSAQLSAGFYPKTDEDARYSYHSYRTRENRMGYGYVAIGRGLFGALGKAPAAIRIDKTTGKTCLLKRNGNALTCSAAPPFRRVHRELLTEKDLQQKLSYVGRAGGEVVLRYWENSGHFARAERTRDVSLPARFPREVEIEGARFVVLEANRTSIRYRLIENFPVQWTRPRPASSVSGG